MFEQLEDVRREICLRVGCNELLETKTDLTGQLNAKVDLEEVQNLSLHYGWCLSFLHLE